MRQKSNLSYVFALVSVGVACNAVLGLEQLERKPPGGSGAEAGMGETGGTSTSGRGGAAGSGQGGSSARGGSSGASSGTAGEGGAGMGGGGTGGDCEPDDVAPCSAVDPSLLGNCRAGEVTCQEDGTWGDCSVTPEGADSCDDVGDDADCDGTPNGGCPCVTGTVRECGPDSEEGICEDGDQTCEDEVWGPCMGAVFPEMRNCLSAEDNDCDGSPDNLRDDVCPCAVDGAHVCVEDAPTDWEGPMALATAAATAVAPSCGGTGYDRQVLTKYGSIDAGRAECGCACGTPSHSCGAANMRHSMALSCAALQQLAGNPQFPNMTPGSCFNVTGSGDNFYPYANYTAGTCTPQPTADLVDASFTERMTGCETNTASPAGCASQSQCVPELVNPLESFCIYRDGDHACPAGPYTVRTLYYDTVSDTRSCTACTCATSTGSCTGRVDFVRQACPGSVLSERINYGDCGPVYDGGLALAAKPGTPTPSGTCTPSGGSVQGSTTTTGGVTVCCKP